MPMRGTKYKKWKHDGAGARLVVHENIKRTTGTPLQMTSATEECPLKPRVSRATEKLAY
jgi:hypothetical protein